MPCFYRDTVDMYPLNIVTGKRVPITPQGRCGKNTCVAPEVFNDEVSVMINWL